MSNYVRELLETALEDSRYALQYAQENIIDTEDDIAALEAKLAIVRTNRDEAQARVTQYATALIALDQNADALVPTVLFEDRGSEPMAQWELELLSPFTIGQKLVVNTQHPFTKFHGKVVTVAKMVHNPNILDDFSWYIETAELDEGEPLTIWANFLSEGA